MRNNKAVCFSGSRSMNTIFSLSRSGPGPIALQPTRQYPFYWGFLRWFVVLAFFLSPLVQERFPMERPVKRRN